MEWQGELSSDPVSPVELWAYYNTVDKKSYIYDGAVWEILAQDGICDVEEITMVDTDTISLTAQKTVILVDSTSADLTITITGTSANGQEVILSNIGTANKCTVVNSVGGWLKDATVMHGQSAECRTANDKLLEGSFAFVWDVATELSFDNGWVNFGATRVATLILRNNRLSLSGIIKNGVVGLVAFTVPSGLGSESGGSKAFPVDSNDAVGFVIIDILGQVVPQIGSNALFYLDGISWERGF
jgi:hypothetical protein